MPKVVVEAVTWERVQKAATMDPVMQELGRLLEEGFPETRNEMGDSGIFLRSVTILAWHRGW